MAFEKREWGLFRLLLSECIKYQLLPELTGIGARDRNVETLLHRVLQRVDSASTFLRIYLETCNDLNVDVMQGLLAVDKHGETPWYHLMNLPDTDMVIQVLSVALEYGIDINSLYTDETSMSFLLHATYRSYKKGQRDSLVSFLKRYGADSRKLDSHNLIPRERRKEIEVDPDSDPPSPSMPCPNGPLDAAEVLLQVPTNDPHPRPAVLHDHVTLVDTPANEIHHPLPGLVVAVDASIDNPDLRPAVLHDHVTLVDTPANEMHHPLPGLVVAVDASTDNPDLRPAVLHDYLTLVDTPANDSHPHPLTLHSDVSVVINTPTDTLHHQPPILHGQIMAVDASADNPPAQLPTPRNRLVDTTIDDFHPRSHGQVAIVDESLKPLSEDGEVPADPQHNNHNVFVSPAELSPRAFLSLSERATFFDYQQMQPTCIPLPESNLQLSRHQLVRYICSILQLYTLGVFVYE